MALMANMAQHRQILGATAHASPVLIIVHDHVQLSVQAVLYAPVVAPPLRVAAV